MIGDASGFWIFINKAFACADNQDGSALIVAVLQKECWVLMDAYIFMPSQLRMPRM